MNKPVNILDRIAAKTRRDGDHLIWLGRYSGDRPVVDLPRPKRGNERNVRTVKRNVRTVLMEAEGKTVPQNMSPVLFCGVRGCVLPGHCRLELHRVGVARPESPISTAVPPSRLPPHLKRTTAVRSVWELGAMP